MNFIKDGNPHKYENIFFVTIYVVLFLNAIIMKDSVVALLSAFCGITYTILAGKGIPVCYLIGGIGSAFYVYLAYKSTLWGNLLLYSCYYIPMQIAGYFQWNKNLKKDKNEIIKIALSRKERVMYFLLTLIASGIVIVVLNHFGDKSPYIDGITAVFSILGMYLTVRRTIDQWLVWIVVNGLSLIMWLKIALTGTRVYSTVFMWAVYFGLAVYFYFCWKKELKEQE